MNFPYHFNHERPNVIKRPSNFQPTFYCFTLNKIEIKLIIVTLRSMSTTLVCTIDRMKVSSILIVSPLTNYYYEKWEKCKRKLRFFFLRFIVSISTPINTFGINTKQKSIHTTKKMVIQTVQTIDIDEFLID